jgi:hypothetical protein
MEDITIGVRYQSLGEPDANADVAIHKRHWVLVFTGEEYAFTIEANRGPGEQQDMLIEMNSCPQAYDAFRLGTFHGEWSDLQKIIEVHPQRRTVYSAWYNNCQHFVAIFLLFLNAFANHTEERHFRLDNSDRYAGITKTLNMSGSTVWNKPNMIMATLKVAAVAGAGATSGASGTWPNSDIYLTLLDIV